MRAVIRGRARTADQVLRERARAVVPGGMYGHQSATLLWPGAPQFIDAGQGARVWDVDGNEYVDLMCSFGPVILGHRHPTVEEAVREQHQRIDCGNGPAPVMVDLAERLVSIVEHAGWVMFAKNGSDATTLSLTLARAHTGRTTILVAEGAYHGAAPWCNPNPTGTVPGDRAHLAYYKFNDLESVEAAARAHEGDIAAVIVSPFRHDAGFDQEMPLPAFARGLRDFCDQRASLLILDDVRCGLRVGYGGSWEHLGVAPDLSAWSKAIANGYALAAVLGSDHVRTAATSVFATGSFWLSADAMAASLATLDVLEETDGVEIMSQRGQQLWRGIEQQASARSLAINLTGHVAMPYLTFPRDVDHEIGDVFAATCAREGLWLHPRHNWFLSAVHSERDIELALHATARAFDAVVEEVSRTKKTDSDA
jgi:glutamate-1-semialdehyde 2,1-aminomutase